MTICRTMYSQACLRSRLFLGLLLVALAPLATHGADSAAETEQRLHKSVEYLASDDLEGRGVGTEGLDKAADYIAAEFAKIGLKTDLFDGTPFQKFTVNVTVDMGPKEENRLAFVGPGKQNEKQDTKAPNRMELKLGEGFTPLAVGGSGQFDAPLVFAGYGITAENLKQDGKELDYDDYASIDAKGKVVIILRKEPQQNDEKSPFNGTKTTQHSFFQRKLANAKEHGAAAVIIVNDAGELEKSQSDGGQSLMGSLEKLAGLHEKLKKANPHVPADSEKAITEIGKVAEELVQATKKLSGPADSLLAFSGAGDETTHPKLPVYFCTRAAIDSLLKASIGKDLSALEEGIDSDLVPRSTELAGWKAVGSANVIQRTAEVKNVVGILEGEGPLADETIVVGAHYDHLGFGGAGSLAPWTTDIHNGADDNASGTATLIEIARQLAAGEKPRRRLVFIAFTGEEKGLLGSAHYVRQPRFPLEKTVAMFNLDMVGRLKDEKLMVYGTGTAKEFDPLVEQLAEKYGFKLTRHPGGFGPSDHSSFYSKKIPVLHLFTGTHSDYHRPSDDTPKINVAGMRRIAEMMVDVVKATAVSSDRPQYLEIKKIEQIGASGDGDRPYFGSMPAYPNPEKDGVLLEAVSEGSPAFKAGVRGGDVLLKVGDSRTTTLEDFQAALSNFKPGDKVKITVRRGKKTVESEAVLTRRGMP